MFALKLQQRAIMIKTGRMLSNCFPAFLHHVHAVKMSCSWKSELFRLAKDRQFFDYVLKHFSHNRERKLANARTLLLQNRLWTPLIWTAIGQNYGIPLIWTPLGRNYGTPLIWTLIGRNRSTLVLAQTSVVP